MQGLSLICAITNEIVIVQHDFGYDYFVVFVVFFISQRSLWYDPQMLPGTFCHCDLQCCIKISLVI